MCWTCEVLIYPWVAAGAGSGLRVGVGWVGPPAGLAALKETGAV